MGGSSRERKKTKSEPPLAQPAAQLIDGTTRTRPWLCTRSVTIRPAWWGEGASGCRSNPGYDSSSMLWEAQAVKSLRFSSTRVDCASSA